MRTKLFLIMAMIAGALQAQEVIDVWPNGAPTQSGITKPQSEMYPGGLTDVTRAIMYVYHPEKPNGQAIVCCPGGGYVHLASMKEGRNMGEWFKTQGITFCVLIYRMPNAHKEIPLDDAREALRIVRRNADKWGVDPQKVGIMGASAGGHLASTAATHLKGADAPNFQVLLYPVITMDEKYTHMGSRESLLGMNPTKEEVELYSNEKQVTKDTPRAFIALSCDDRVVPPYNTLAYAQAMVDNDLEVCVHMYPINGHGWGWEDYFPYKAQWTNELEKWLREINR